MCEVKESSQHMGRKLRGRTVNRSSLKKPLLVEYSTDWLGLPDCGKPNYLELSLVLKSLVSPTSVSDMISFDYHIKSLECINLADR